MLENRIAWLGRARVIPYLFQIAPNPHVIYEDKLPDGERTSQERPMMQLLEHLERAGSDAHVLYPVKRAKCSHIDRAVYPRTATHWSELGAFIAYEAADGRAWTPADFGLRRLSMDDVDWVEAPLPGDLGNKMDPKEESPFVFGDIRDPAREARARQPDRANSRRRVEFEAPGLDTSAPIFLSPPTLRKTFSSRTRRKLTWVFSSMVAISSRNTVPPAACSKIPFRATSAPVKEPLS